MGTTAEKSAVPAVKLTLGSIAEVEKTYGNDLIEVVVDQLADGPTTAYAKLNTHDLEWINKAEIKPNQPMKVSLGFGQGAAASQTADQGKLFDGVIVGWEPQFYGKTPSTLIVRGFNKLHAASRGRRYKTFLNQKLSDVAAGIAGRYGMGSKIDDTKIQQPFIVQQNSTDLDFLREMAEHVGYEVGCDVDNNLMFRKPALTEGPSVTYVWGQNLKRFKARFNTAQPISKVKCSYWDPVQKKAVTGVATTSDVAKMGGSKSAADHAGTFEKDSAELFVHNRPYYSPDDAKAEAQGLIQDLGLQLIVAEVEGEGDPQAHAGKTIAIQGTGNRFDGTYYIIRARHVLRIDPKLPDFGYVCYLTVRRSGAAE